MKIVPPEPSIRLYEDGFEGKDILQRRRLGAALSDLLNRIDDPLVIALDGKWGTGKTYFLKRWVAEHARGEGRVAVVYFDAFAHDVFGDPLPALVSALEERISGSDADSSTAEKIEEIKKAAFKLAKPIARVGLAAAGAGTLLNTADEFAKARNEDAVDSYKRFWEAEEGRRLAMKKFRDAITSLADRVSGGTGSTVVVVVDELDRCRPDYALDVLEVIKHFFTVPRLHFVLGVNLTAIEDMVRARYGYRIDAHAYLAKFIQVTLDLPDEFNDANQQKHSVLVYLDHLLGDMRIPPRVAGQLRQTVKVVSRSNNVSLRDIGNIVSSLSLAGGEVAEGQDLYAGWNMVMIHLVVSRIVRPDLYPKFLDATITPPELESYLGATEVVRQENLHGKFNPDHDSNISLSYYVWIYLSRNGQISDDDPRILKEIVPQLFAGRHSIGMPTPRSLPMQVHRRFLDRFSFFRDT